jgi:4-hydroxybenzoate polyprenyltransferase
VIVLLRQYLTLIRLPSIFTAPTNILAGYFAAIALPDANSVHLLFLMSSSAMLYMAGMVLNDYFDIPVDKKERPSRPLASGAIKKRNALIVALAALATANIILLAMVGLASFVISMALSGIIVAYNFRLKRNTIAGSLSMGAARFLNVILGASPILGIMLLQNDEMKLSDSLNVMIAAGSLFAYVIAIMTLSKREVMGGDKKDHLVAVFIVIAVIASVGVLGFVLQFQPTFIINLSLFAAVMIFTFTRYLAAGSSAELLQKAVRNMVVSIIILDSVFVSGAAGLVYGMGTLLFIIPAVVLAKKMYVT